MNRIRSKFVKIVMSESLPVLGTEMRSRNIEMIGMLNIEDIIEGVRKRYEYQKLIEYFESF